MADSEGGLKARWILIAVGGLIVAAIGIMFAMGGKKPEEAKIIEKAVPVRTMTVAPVELADEIVLPGRLEPAAQARVSAEAPGRIVELSAGKGDKVSVDQVLLRVESRNAEAMVKQFEIQYREGTNELRRLTELKARGAVSDSDYENVKKMSELAAVSLEDARVRLTQCQVRSPLAGVVNDRFVELGEYANPGMPSFHIVDVSSVKVYVDVPERDIRFVKPDSEIKFTIEAFKGRTFSGKVIHIAAAGNRDNNTFKVEVLADNKDAVLKPGMIASVVLPGRASRPVMLLPLSAIIPQKGDHVIFLVEKGVAVRRVVKIDEIKGSEATISEGLKAGDNVVVEGGRALMDGSAVRVEQAAAAVSEGAAGGKSAPVKE